MINKKIRARKRQLKKLGVPYVSEAQASDLMTFQASYILAGLEAFYRLKRYAAPPVDICGQISGCLTKPSPREIEQAQALARKKWDEALQEMIYSFRQAATDYEDSPYTKWFNKNLKQLVAAGVPPYVLVDEQGKTDTDDASILQFNLPQTPAAIMEAEKAYRKRLKQGFMLYGMYFQDFWD